MHQDDSITVGDAYRAMFEYLDAYWREGKKSEDEIANLLSSMQYSDLLGPTKPMVQSYWNKWLVAVDQVTKK